MRLLDTPPERLLCKVSPSGEMASTAPPRGALSEREFRSLPMPHSGLFVTAGSGKPLRRKSHEELGDRDGWFIFSNTRTAGSSCSVGFEWHLLSVVPAFWHPKYVARCRGIRCSQLLGGTVARAGSCLLAQAAFADLLCIS